MFYVCVTGCNMQVRKHFFINNGAMDRVNNAVSFTVAICSSMQLARSMNVSIVPLSYAIKKGQTKCFLL